MEKYKILIQGSWGDKAHWKSESNNLELQTDRFIWIKLSQNIPQLTVLFILYFISKFEGVVLALLKKYLLIIYFKHR